MSRRFGVSKGDDLSVTPRIQAAIDIVDMRAEVAAARLEGRINANAVVVDDIVDAINSRLDAVNERLDRIDPPGPPEDPGPP